MHKTTRMSLGLALALVAPLTACNLSSTQASNSQQATAKARQQTTAQPNLISLFLAKQDNLNNEMRGEIYPIALLLNGTYVDVSQDVTTYSRLNAETEYLVRVAGKSSMLNAIKNFTVFNQGQPLGEFAVQQLNASQFACSTMLTGQGSFQAERSLQSVYDAIPADQSGGFSGTMNNREFDETWRWTLAVSQTYPVKSDQSAPEAATDPQKQDLITLAQQEFSQNSKLEGIEGEVVVEQTAVVDLDQDGKPEVYGLVRKGPNPQSEASQTTSRSRDAAEVTGAYLNLWLTYDQTQPKAIASQLTPYNAISAKPEYNLLSTLDLNGDGIQEVIVKNNGYEGTSFGIYEYQQGQLQSVFNGAGYGC